MHTIQTLQSRSQITAVWAVSFVAILGVFSLWVSLPASAVSEYDCGTYSAGTYGESCPDTPPDSTGTPSTTPTTTTNATGTGGTNDGIPTTPTGNNGSSSSNPTEDSPAAIAEQALKSVDSYPWWIWLIIAIFVAIIIWLIIVKRRKKKDEPSNV